MTERKAASTETAAATSAAAPEQTAGQNLIPERLPDEDDSAYLLRTKNMVVDSQNPTDIVPNWPQITFGPQEPLPPPPAAPAAPAAPAEEP
jgi:hypothetical protein